MTDGGISKTDAARLGIVRDVRSLLFLTRVCTH